MQKKHTHKFAQGFTGSECHENNNVLYQNSETRY